MPLQLTVDGERWRAHLRKVAQAQPGLVPVAKGNGYGFGLDRLAHRAAWLGADTVASLSADEVRHHVAHGAITGGMAMKVDTALQAVAAGVPEVIVAGRARLVGGFPGTRLCLAGVEGTRA